MDIDISNNTGIVFVIYGYLIIQHIYLGKKQQATQSLLLILGLVVTAWVLEPISHTSIPFIILLFLSAYCSIERNKTNSTFSNMAICFLAALSFLLATHKIPGFHNELIFSSDSFGESALPFYLYANLDKALAALAILVAFKNTITWRVSLADAKLISLSLMVFF